MRVLHDNVLIELEKAPTTSKIVLPQNYEMKETPLHGVVRHVGKGIERLPDGTLIPLQVKVGDKVLIKNYAGVEMNIEEKDCRLVRQSEILLVL